MATKIKRMKKEEWISNIIEVGDRIERIEPSRDFLNHIVTSPRIKIIAKSSAWLAAASIILLIVINVSSYLGSNQEENTIELTDSFFSYTNKI